MCKVAMHFQLTCLVMWARLRLTWACKQASGGAFVAEQAIVMRARACWGLYVLCRLVIMQICDGCLRQSNIRLTSSSCSQVALAVGVPYTPALQRLWQNAMR